MKRPLRWIIFSLVIASLLLSACAQAPKAPAKEAPAVLETVEGSELKRVKLTEKAAARLGIKTEAVKEALVTRKRTVGGLVVDLKALADSGTTIPVTGTDGTYVSARLSESDLALFDKSQPVSIKPLNAAAGTEGLDSESLAMDAAASDVSAPMFFKVNSAGDSLAPGESVYVEFALTGSAEPKKMVPYSAVLYDLNGETWIYTSPSPLVFTRQNVVVDYIDGDVAVLLEGPDKGMQVVTVGVPELYGFDTGVGK